MGERGVPAVWRGFVDGVWKQLVIAGGERSCCCGLALGIEQLQIGPKIDPGVPWCHAPTESGGVHITLKSGNFGTPDFFTKTFGALN